MAEESYPPIQFVIFDFHCTLVDNGNAKEWLKRAQHAMEQSSSTGDPSSKQVKVDDEELAKRIDQVWEIAKRIDPKARRDLSREQHEQVFHRVMTELDVDLNLSRFLYQTLSDGWGAYNDSIPTLHRLKQKGIRMGLISNVGFDIRPVLKREKLEEYFDCIVLSCEFGECKPSGNIFRRVVDLLQAKVENCLMVGDDVHADGAAGLIGMRTLILPKTFGPIHGLGLVDRLCTL